jgi:hypothetical protein
MTFTRERAGLRGLSRNDLPFAPKSSGPSRGLRPPYRVSDRSLRPTRLRVDSSHGVSVPYDDSRLQVRSTRDCLTRHLPTSGFGYPLAGLLPAHDTDPKIGHRPWGSPFRALYPPASRTRFRAVALMPFPVHPSFSSEDEKVGCSAATPGPCSGRRAVSFREVEPPFRAEPSWVSILSEALARPRWPRLPGTSPHVLPRRKRPKPPTTPALQGVTRGEVRRALASPPAPLRSVASPVRSRVRRCWFEPR